MSRPARLRLDFVAASGAPPALGILLCAAGAVLALAMGYAFSSALGERNRLDAELGGLAQPRRSADPAQAKVAAEAQAVEQELAVPWTALLASLEEASHDLEGKVALLHVEPDPVKHSVKVTAEVRTLGDGLLYVKRLQQSPVLRFPMLQSHERRKDDPQHPLRIQVDAEWRP